MTFSLWKMGSGQTNHCDNDSFMFSLWIPKICLCSYLFGIINIYVPVKKYKSSLRILISGCFAV